MHSTSIFNDTPHQLENYSDGKESLSSFRGAPGLESEKTYFSFGEISSESFFRESVNFTLENFTVDVWSIFDENHLRHSLVLTIGLTILYMLILIVGIIGNSMVILVVVFRPHMRSVTNIFILNLAIADLLVIIFCVPATLLSNVLYPWILGSFMCKAVAYVQGVSVCASAYSLVATSIDRCKAIYQPMKRGLSEAQAIGAICLIWIGASLLLLPWAFVFHLQKSEVDDRINYCIEAWDNNILGKLYFLFANLICCYAIPLVVISISNILILSHVNKREIPQNSAMTESVERVHKRTRHEVKKMLSIVTLVFLLSWMPLYGLAIRMKFASRESVSETESNIFAVVVPFAQWLGMSNSSVNPVLYAFLNSKFRESFKSLLPSWMPFARRKSTFNSGSRALSRIFFNNGAGPVHIMRIFTVRKSVRSHGNTNVTERENNTVAQGHRILLRGDQELENETPA